MRNSFPGLCLILALLLAAVCALLAIQKSSLEKRVDFLQGSMQEKEAAEQSYRTKLEKLTRQKEDFKRRAEMLAADLKTNRLSFTAITSGTTSTNRDKPANGLVENQVKSALNPEMRKALREQKEGFLNTAYAPLFKTMALSADEMEKFKGMVLDQEMKNAERMLAYAKLAQDPVAQTNALSEIARDQAAFEDKLKTLLGDNRFAEYQDYNQSIGQRVAVDQFAQQLSGGATALTDEQGQQLLQIMGEEQRGMPGLYNPDDTAGIAEAASLQSMTDERMNELFGAMQEADQRVLQRSADVLTANQLEALASFLTAELQSQSSVMAQARMSPALRAP